jgi:hypothetical protein
MMQKRASNSATVDAVARVCRADLHNGLDPKKYMATDPEVFCQYFWMFIINLLKLTNRIVTSVMTPALISTFPAEPKAEIHAFVQRLKAAVLFCNQKKRSVKTGQRLPQGVKQIVRYMNKVMITSLKVGRDAVISGSPPTSSGPVAKIGKILLPMERKLVRRARVLHRRKSEASAASSGAEYCQVSQPSGEQEASSPPCIARASSSNASRNEILAQYGLGPDCKSLDTGAGEESPVDLVSCSSPDPEVDEKPLLEWVNNVTLTVDRVLKNGIKVSVPLLANIETGFCTFQFAGEPPQQSEVPNLALQPMLKEKKKQLLPGRSLLQPRPR